MADYSLWIEPDSLFTKSEASDKIMKEELKLTSIETTTMNSRGVDYSSEVRSNGWFDDKRETEKRQWNIANNTTET